MFGERIVCAMLRIIISLLNRTPPSGKDSRLVVTDLPLDARRKQVEIKFSEHPPLIGCWGIDDVIVTSSLNRPSFIDDNMEGIELGNWLETGTGRSEV